MSHRHEVTCKMEELLSTNLLKIQWEWSVCVHSSSSSLFSRFVREKTVKNCWLSFLPRANASLLPTEAIVILMSSALCWRCSLSWPASLARSPSTAHAVDVHSTPTQRTAQGVGFRSGCDSRNLHGQRVKTCDDGHGVSDCVAV